ncbi:hypothetical protein CFK37_17700 [Virgibacillus phasianinus]|uniref:Spectinomycin 9-adenylyltransferase n=1 Tax=Virgibacillus phasianinus TaxID=2017483 RepID=A0A220U7B3_9BACI|nr:aminoglycoside adenylyltransferase domain-containing protein [Virgibacillus phasianinus]ASK63862.1 hypothetical protein CFK37_17700 [Virgibacillus phasianinus]
MLCNWITCSSAIKKFVFHLLNEIKELIKEDLIGFYIHGSLAMGGFNPGRSDIDILVVTSNPITVETKRKLAQLFLTISSKPYPVEISFLNETQLRSWKHPSPFDFHYSECWRRRYEDDLAKGKYQYLNEKIKTDADLAAHIMITTNRGVCLEGKPIIEVFPLIPRSHYLSSIMGDFQDCLENIEVDPIYSILNLIRVYWFLKEGIISSKQEAGNWGLSSLPKGLCFTIQKVVDRYSGVGEISYFEKDELLSVRNYLATNVQELLIRVQ